MPQLQNVAQVEIRFLLDNERVENVFHCLAPPPFNQVVADDIHDIVDNWITQTLRPNQSSNVIYQGMKIRDIVPTGPAFEYPGDNQAGTAAGNPLANEVTFCLKKVTALSGRKYRGRFYHIGLPDSFMLSASSRNRLSPTAVFALVSTYAALMTALAGAGYTLQVIQKDYTVIPPMAVTTVPVISIVATDNIVDSQRRRGPGRGR